MRFFIDPFGCVKNQVDAETMMALLGGAGWSSAEDPGDADLIIINSCGFIESAKQESINAVLGWRKRYPDKKILLAGCLAQRYAKELAESLPEADLLFGNADLGGIVEAAARALGVKADAAAIRNAPGKGDSGAGRTAGRRPLLSLPGSAYVKINEGCNNRCTFCSIPLIRGNLRSRSIPDVLSECRELLGRGIRELCLIGQDIGSYGKDFAGGGAAAESLLQGSSLPGSLLPDLLEALSALEGDFWVRLLYIHPDNFPLPILDIMERDKRFLPYFDLPFQHGSEKILAAMNRRGNADTYLSLIETIRSRLPDAVLRTTFLLGFPGETEEDFQALLDFQDKARLDWAGCFAYSREEDTPAYSMKNRVPKKLATERKRIVEEQQISISEKQMDRFVGRELDVLIEEKFEQTAEEDGLYLGRLYCQAPEVDGATVISGGDLTPGAFFRGRVIARSGVDLELVRIP
ncbi:ribosomal protein S12 methylthiotransferase RimO [Spirochaetia bacterium]|nr:ribosomal protein S12 methylthiotransferase RimO [Spirochaetia bacterium]